MLQVGANSQADSSWFEASIVPCEQNFRLGDRIRFEVRIRNRGPQAAWLSCVADGSEVGSSPGLRIEISGPPEGYNAFRYNCQSKNGITAHQLALVRPGELFDPYSGRGAEPFGEFLSAGRFVATFRYSTLERDPWKWTGLQGHGVRPQLLQMLDKVAIVEVSASTTFDILP